MAATRLRLSPVIGATASHHAPCPPSVRLESPFDRSTLPPAAVASRLPTSHLVIEPDRTHGALRNWVPFGVGGAYRYFTGSLAYVLHRVSGLALLVYLFFHIHSITEASHADPRSYDVLVRRFQETDFKLGELALFAALLFHGLNGLRILLVDFTSTGTHWHKRLFWGLAVLTAVLFVLGAIPLILHSNVQPFFSGAR